MDRFCVRLGFLVAAAILVSSCFEDSGPCALPVQECQLSVSVTDGCSPPGRHEVVGHTEGWVFELREDGKVYRRSAHAACAAGCGDPFEWEAVVECDSCTVQKTMLGQCNEMAPGGGLGQAH